MRHPLTSLHDTIESYFCGEASMLEVQAAVLDRGRQLEVRGLRGATIVADVKSVARTAAQRANAPIAEPVWQQMLAPLEVFFTDRDRRMEFADFADFAELATPRRRC